MTTEAKRYTGGCLCGALRYEAFGEPMGSGHCYCSTAAGPRGRASFPSWALGRRPSASPAKPARSFEGGERRRGGAQPLRPMLSLVFGGETGGRTPTRSTPVRSTIPPPSTRRSPSSPRVVRPGRQPGGPQGVRTHAGVASIAASLVHGGRASTAPFSWDRTHSRASADRRGLASDHRHCCGA